jgi:beta-lactamase superfamily II metal-dependent hydrolase
MEVTIYRKQWPVGHGGFATGSVNANGESFNYIYDCGSMKSDVIKKQIVKYREEWGGVVDALFISHVDRDHINGLDSLLSMITVKTVYLPYLTEADTFMLGAQLLIDDDLTGHGTNFLADPVKWFKSRGVIEVVGIKRKRSGSQMGLQHWEPPSTDRSEISDRQLNLLDNISSQDETDESPSSYDLLIPTEHCQAFMDNGDAIVWILAPFVPPFIDDSKIPLLINDIKSEFELDCKDEELNSKTLTTLLANKENHPKVKKLYLKYVNDVNKASMCLYSGQLDHNDHSVAWSAAFNNDSVCLYTDRVECGWMGTGDYDLKSPATITSFSEHFSHVDRKVVSFMLPHHGSNNNFSEKAVAGFAPKVFFVNCPPGIKKHPHQSIIDLVKTLGKPLVRIQESDKSSLREEITITVPLPVGSGSIKNTLFWPVILPLVTSHKIQL